MKTVSGLVKIANHFKIVLPAEDFILVGSTALSLLGFGKIEIKDLDILLIEPVTSTLDVLKELQAECPVHNLSKYPNLNVFRFKYEGVPVDVFIDEKTNAPDCKLVTEGGMKLAPLSYIINQKKRLNRPKDYVQLLQLRNKILSDIEFSNYTRDYK